MSDSRLRKLERQFKETGAVDDEAAYLLERVRTGDLSATRLELAALLGQPAAMRATQSKGPPDLSADAAEGESELFPVLSGWLRDLCSLEPEAGIRAALACCEAGLPRFETLHPECREPRRLLAVVRGWLDDQTSESREEVVADALAAEEAVSDATLYDGPLPDRLLGFAPTYCGLVLADEATLRAHGSGMFTDSLSAVCQAASTVAAGIGPEPTAQSICESLLPWVLRTPQPR